MIVTNPGRIKAGVIDNYKGRLSVTMTTALLLLMVAKDEKTDPFFVDQRSAQLQ